MQERCSIKTMKIELKKVLRFAVENDLSDFYRKKYEKEEFDHRSVDSTEDIAKIPFLEKREILAVPLKERTMVPPESVAYYSVSSGTTDSMNPLIVPQSGFGLSARSMMNRICADDIDIKKLLFLMPPMAPSFMRLIHPLRESGKLMMPGNIRNLELTAKIAAEIGVDAIFTTPTLLSFFIEPLKRTGFDPRSIKIVSLRGEICSTQKFDLFREVFPNAEIDIKYGGSEMGEVMGYRCRHLIDSPPNTYHPSPKCMIESIDEEIIYTDLSPEKAFPLIRYRTGDFGSLERSDCPCGNGTLLKIGGRIGHDKLKFHGVTLYTESIEDSLVEAAELMEPGRFRVHVGEEKGRPRLTVELGLKEGVETGEFVKGVIAESIMKRLYLSSEKTLKDLVDEGIFLPLELTMKKDWPHDPKSRNIISHL